jgi:hypothetical protein
MLAQHRGEGTLQEEREELLPLDSMSSVSALDVTLILIINAFCKSHFTKTKEGTTSFGKDQNNTGATTKTIYLYILMYIYYYLYILLYRLLVHYIYIYISY